ncbi:MAG: autotransporter domain-containing protein [Gammaproteobacteria bacterium]|nr:autotransporter domain-containing protein [Gammaproteobacteria bacterium]
MHKRLIYIPIIAFALLSQVNVAFAQMTGVLAVGDSYPLTGTNTASGCGTPFDGTHPASGTMTFTSVTTSGTVHNYMATLNITDGNSVVFNGNMTGTISTAGAGMSGSGSYAPSFGMGGSWTVSAGVISGGTLTMTVPWTDFLCTGSFSLTGTNAAYSSGTNTTTSVQSGSTVTATTTQQTFVRSVSRISKRANFALRTFSRTRPLAFAPRGSGLDFGGQGLAGGDEDGLPIGLWGSVNYTGAEDDSATSAFDSDRYAFLGGIDVALRDDFLMGVALGYDRTETDTTFNNGEQTTDGYTIAPYFGAVLGDNLSVDLSIGYSGLDIEQFRRVTGSTTRINSKPDADRVFVSGNANYTRQYGEWILSGRAGVIWAKDDYDGFAESDGTQVAAQTIKLGQIRLGAEVAYTLGAFEPFVAGTFENDYKHSGLVGNTSIDDTGGVFGMGVRFFSEGGLSGSVEYSTILGRDNYDEDSINLLLRADF